MRFLKNQSINSSLESETNHTTNIRSPWEEISKNAISGGNVPTKNYLALKTFPGLSRLDWVIERVC